jgi:ribosomal protein S18 acetylase RimI-like enzyme
MRIRPTRPDDVTGISEMLTALADAGKRTRPSDPDFVRSTYVENDALVSSHVAEGESGRILGLQVVILAGPDDPFGVPEGYGSIGTHVAPDAGHRGIGSRLFEATEAVVRQSGLPAADASIADDNAEGLQYYEAMGFRTDREGAGRIVKRLSFA